LERQYPPYPKWFGTAFGKLSCAPRLRPHLEAAQKSRTWRERQSGLSSAYEALVEIQGKQGLADQLPGRVSDFWDRPFLVIHGGEIADAIFSRIVDEQLTALARGKRIGSVDLITDNTDVLEDLSLLPFIRAMYRS
jgi:hypothetical protein